MGQPPVLSGVKVNVTAPAAISAAEGTYINERSEVFSVYVPVPPDQIPAFVADTVPTRFTEGAGAPQTEMSGPALAIMSTKYSITVTEVEADGQPVASVIVTLYIPGSITSITSVLLP